MATSDGIPLSRQQNDFELSSIYNTFEFPHHWQVGHHAKPMKCSTKSHTNWNIAHRNGSIVIRTSGV